MEPDDVTSLRVRVAVLETELSHSLVDKASALASAHQTITLLTSIINRQLQSHNAPKFQIPANEDHSIFTPKNTEIQDNNVHPDVKPERVERKDTDLDILQLRQQILKINLDNKRLRDALRVEVRGKAVKATDRYLGMNGDGNGRDNTTNQVQVQQAGEASESAAESPRNLIDIDSPDNTILSTNQVSEAEDEFEEDVVDFESQENRELDDFEAIDDLLGPEPGMTPQHMRLREQAIERQPTSSGAEYRVGPKREHLCLPISYGSKARRCIERWESRELDCLMKTSSDRDSELAGFVNLELQYGDAPKSEDIRTEEMKAVRKCLVEEDIDGENQDYKKIDKKAENPIKSGDTSLVVSSVTTPEAAVERKPSAADKFDYSPCPVNILRSRGRNGYHGRENYKGVPFRYKDDDRTPLPRTGATIPRRQRVLEAYDFTPSGVPDFNLSVIPSIVSTAARGSRPLFFKETSSVSEEPYFDASLWKSALEREDAITRHKADCTSNESRFPEFFHYGISFRPEDNEAKHLRTVHIRNLPVDISMCSMLAKVRGGDVLHAVICNTISITGSLSALVVFKQSEAAAAYVKFAKTNSISFSKNQKQRLVVKVLDTPSWPANNTFVKYGQTRVLVIQNELTASMKARLKKDLRVPEDHLVEICDRPDGRLEIQFSGERAAGQAYSRMTGWRNFASLKVEFAADPCSGPLSDLLTPAGPRISPYSEPKKVNSDEINADDGGEIVEIKKNCNSGRDENENVIGAAPPTCSNSLSWADEMNDVAASTDSAIDLSVHTQKPPEPHPLLGIEGQEPKHKPKGLAGSRYATLVPGY